MDVANGGIRRALTHSTDVTGRLLVGRPNLSGSWLAWEEVGSGDDLTEPVSWRLCAAPIDRRTLTIGKPRLVAAASNVLAMRPFFRVAGSELLWVTTEWTRDGEVKESRLTAVDLETDRRRVLYRADKGRLSTVGVIDDRVVLEENPVASEPGVRYVVLDLDSGAPIESFTIGNRYTTSHWPAWRDGWLAWAAFGAEVDTTFPELYIRTPNGELYGEGVLAADPCFAGPYLFYQAERSTGYGSTTETMHEIRALRLSDMTTQVLLSSKVEKVGSWQGTCDAPDLGRYLVTYLDRSRSATKERDRFTIIRVYDVK